MEYRIVLSVLLIAHFLGDFYLQSNKMMNDKNNKWKIMGWHGLIYTMCFVTFTHVFFWHISWLFPLLISALHLFIEILKRWLLKHTSIKKHPMRLFFADQVIHIAIIGIVALFYAISQGIAYSSFSIQLRELYIGLHVELPARQVIHLTCIFLFVWKPAGLITAKLLETVRYNKQSVLKKEQKFGIITGDIAGKAVNLHLQQSIDESQITVRMAQKQRAGRYIGILERYLTVIFFLLGQYTAIAFTLTAKSVARFKELEDADFAEQYLIGTLVSQLLAILSVLILSGS